MAIWYFDILGIGQWTRMSNQKYRCGEALADTNLVCGWTYLDHKDTRRHMRIRHGCNRETSIQYVEGDVTTDAHAAMNIREFLRLCTTTQAGAAQFQEAAAGETAIEVVHQSEGNRDFWTTVMGKGAGLPDSTLNQRPIEEQEAARKPPKKMRELIAEAISSHPDHQMYMTEIIRFFRTHYPWYSQPARGHNAGTYIERALEYGSKGKTKHFEENIGRWRLTTQYRRELEEVESRPVVTGFLFSSSTTK